MERLGIGVIITHTITKVLSLRACMFFHKPGAEHDAWRAKKDCFKKGGPKEHTVTTPKVPTSATGSSDPLAAKLSLSKSLQAALVTIAGLSADQFQKIWADACSKLGNEMAPNVGLRV